MMSNTRTPMTHSVELLLGAGHITFHIACTMFEEVNGAIPDEYETSEFIQGIMQEQYPTAYDVQVEPLHSNILHEY